MQLHRRLDYLPGLLGDLDSEFGSYVSKQLESKLQNAQVFRIEGPKELNGEVLGLRPELAACPSGPLIIAALRVEPPIRSTHFWLSSLSLVDGVIQKAQSISESEQLSIKAVLPRLNRKALTLLAGFEFDHALVWEALGDLATTAVQNAIGQEYCHVLPEGDGEPMLRSLIDDSVNLLGDLPLNHERLEMGLAPINLLWPWGNGVRPSLPNLALHRGAPMSLRTDSIEIAGFGRLCGYRPQLQAALPPLGPHEVDQNHATVSAWFRWLRDRQEHDRAVRMLETWLNSIFDHFQEKRRTQTFEWLVVSDGLAFLYRSYQLVDKGVPFNAESAQDTSVTALPLWELVDRFLTGKAL